MNYTAEGVWQLQILRSSDPYLEEDSFEIFMTYFFKTKDLAYAFSRHYMQDEIVKEIYEHRWYSSKHTWEGVYSFLNEYTPLGDLGYGYLDEYSEPTNFKKFIRGKLSDDKLLQDCYDDNRFDKIEIERIEVISSQTEFAQITW